MIENYIINFDDHIETYSYSGPIGDHLTELGFAEFKFLAVEFVEDEMGEVDVLDVRNEDTDQIMWEQPSDEEWMDDDDLILESLICWYDNKNI